MKITVKNIDGKPAELISTVATQKEIINFLNYNYCIDKNKLIQLIKKERAQKHVWTAFYSKATKHVIMIYLEKRKMFIGITPRENWQNVISAEI